MNDRAYDAILLDLDGTLLTSEERVHPETRAALEAARSSGVRVMVVTGRSKTTALPVLEELGLDSQSVLFNGAAVYCPLADKLIEERTLSNRSLARLLDFTRATGDLTVVMTADEKFAFEPLSVAERTMLWDSVKVVSLDEFHVEYVIRTTFLSQRPSSSQAFASEIEAHVGHPLYTTHFPLSVLPRYRDSRVIAVDVHPPCRGKAEALRILHDTYGVPPERVVAVGDATNDAPMIEAAGLGIAMGNSMTELKAIADRVIEHHDTGAVGQLVRELFL